ncbi:DUF4870 domain-containing protein [Hassallia byssoidea VB512170]|jgi:hypothetical protein|uniref:DUF4870 domain-containing protein n=1 Tax=Hassallia byssoidea VB512170 TaxID=1304833 RepID=A0A846HDG3_9CYAN|nr:DUF4870 domain-containing protein [Hassalia byssoidea]MBW4572899.1 DUF4870 domain-containing protein [Tolypothrix carrinoi HA7290-LM1]NEU75093.1 DUF4870 domain-containing protein [Hassalia byssoidea VB512170]
MRGKTKQQIRVWAMLCHLSALLAWILLILVVIIGIPLYLPLNVLAPLIIWRVKKTQYTWVDFQGKESLNFQLSLTFYVLILVIISLLLVFTGFGIAMTSNGTANYIEIIFRTLLIGCSAIVVFMLLLQSFVVTCAAIKAYRGEYYRYPFTIRFLI